MDPPVKERGCRAGRAGRVLEGEPMAGGSGIASRRLFRAGLASLLLALPSASTAAEAEMSLDQAMARFFTQNYDILIHRYEIDKVYGDFVGARLRPNPTFTFNDTQNEVRLPPKATQFTTTSFRLDQLIELGGKRDYRTRAAGETYAAARLSHDDTIRTLLAGFLTVYFNLNLDALNADLASDALRRFDRTLEIADKRFGAGNLSLVDYLKLKVARIDLENGLAAAEAQLKNDGEQLALLLALERPPKPAVRLLETFPARPEDELLRAAYENRFDYLSLRSQLKAADHNRALARAQRIPDVTVGVEYDLSGADHERGIGFGFGLPIPLFNRNQGDILRKDAEYRQVELQVEKARRQVVVDVRLALNNRAASLKVFESYRNRSAEMGDLLQKSERAFALGGITVLDLLDTQKTYREFRAKYSQALVQANLNDRLLKIATGEIR